MNELLKQVGEALFIGDIVSHFDFVVQLSMRCFNAGASWRSNHPEQLSTVFTSEIGIFRYINDIARSYVYGSTPASILFEDDFLVHGSSLSKVVEGFISELTCAIKKMGGTGEVQARKDILRNLYARVYMANDNTTLLKRDVMARIHADKIVSMPILRKSSVAFVRQMLLEIGCGAAHALCACWPLDVFASMDLDESSDHWTSLTTTHNYHVRCDGQRLYVLKLPRRDVVITLRAIAGHNKMYLVPTVHHGDMDWKHVQRLESALYTCVRVSSGETKRFAIKSMLDCAMKVSSLTYRTAFADMLLGQVAVSAFVQTCGLKHESYNVKRVAEFYGMNYELGMLRALTLVSFGWDDLKTMVEQLPGIGVQVTKQAAGAVGSPCGSKQEVARIGVLAAGYNLALSSELDLQSKQRARAYLPRDYAARPYRWEDESLLLPPKTYVAWTEFVNKCAHKCEDPSLWTKAYSLDAIYASIYELVDNEQLSILYAEHRSPNNQVVSQVVGPTEMSLSILPSAMRPDMWEWFRNTVRYCRIHGLSIEKTMRQLGYNEDSAKGANILLAEAASALEGRRYMDVMVLDWDAGVSLT